jgi:quinate dehydrogenase
MNAPPNGKTYYLFGFPIAHSAAPALHNHCFNAWNVPGQKNFYELWSTSKITHAMLNRLGSDGCGGAA